MPKNLRNLFLLTLLSILILSPLQPVSFAQDNINFTDIQALKLPNTNYQSPAAKKDNRYIEQYNRGVSYYNNQDYSKALPIFKVLAETYNDGGLSLYLAGTSYYFLNQYDQAVLTLQKAALAGHDRKETDSYIGSSLNQQGDIYCNNKGYPQAIAYYKASLKYRVDPSALHNTVFSYIELAKQLRGTDRVIALLYGYEFMKQNSFQGDILNTLANNLCNYLLYPPLYDQFESSIECIQNALTLADDPFLHQSLGLIYLYQNKETLAKPEFKKVIDNYPHSKFYKGSLDRYLEIGASLYQYKAIYPIQVGVSSGAVTSLKAEILTSIPQNHPYQTVRGLRVSFNNQNIPFKIVQDKFGGQYLSLNLQRLFRGNSNHVVVEAEVEVTSKRFSRGCFNGLKISSYRRDDPRYLLLTQSSETVDLNNPQIQKMAALIKNQAGSDDLGKTVRMVYQYVIDLMEYKMRDGNQDKVGVKRALQNLNTAVCEDYAVLTVALLRALKIPASYFSGENYGSPIGHAWAVFYTPDYMPIYLDTTWGDTSNSPDLFFLAASNLNVTRSVTCESELMPGSTNIKLNTVGDQGVTATLDKIETTLKRLNK